MSISIPKTDLPQSDRVRVTLRFEAFSEDGEFATVTDPAGHRSEIPLSSILQGDHDSLIPGDTAACDMLREVWAESGLVPDEEPAETEETDGQELPEASPDDTPPPDDVPEEIDEMTTEQTPSEQAAPEQAMPDPAPPAFAGVHNVHRKGRDIIEVVLPLTNAERLELADEMAQALAERDRLESEFNAIKKDFKTRIDLQVSVAAAAGATFREGERTQTVSCDLFEDRTTCELIWLDSVSGLEIKRRGMTYEERQLKFPGLDVPRQESKKKPTTDALPPDLSPDTARTCISCGHRDANGNAATDAMPEPCHTCSQIESGDSDNWTPIRECTTCAHKTTRVNMPPCNACQRNADEGHRGKDDEWEWAQQPEQALPDAEPAHTDEHDALPDIPCSDDAPDDQHTPDELDGIPPEHTPDELDGIPVEGIPQDDDAMPSLSPIGGGTEPDVPATEPDVPATEPDVPARRCGNEWVWSLTHAAL